VDREHARSPLARTDRATGKQNTHHDNGSGGCRFRPVLRGDVVRGDVLSEKAVWQLLRPYATAAGVPGIAPHDCRRTAAKLCRAAGGELEQIQMLLGHASSASTSVGTSGTEETNMTNTRLKMTLVGLDGATFKSASGYGY
jgi:integrase